MTPLEILEAHESRLLNYACSCGAEFPPPNEQGRPYLKYRAHVAQVLDQHMLEREAAAWELGAATAWQRSTPQINGTNYYWRSAGEPDNPHR